MANGSISRSDTVDSAEDKQQSNSGSLADNFASSTDCTAPTPLLVPLVAALTPGTAPRPVSEPRSAPTSANASVNNLAEMGGGAGAGGGERATSGRRRAAATLRTTVSSTHSGGSNEGMDDSGSATDQVDMSAPIVPLHEEEYVVLIRPVDVSVAYASLGTRAPITSLSKATMVKHNKQQKEDGERPVISRKRSQSGSSSSGSGGSGDVLR